MTSRKTNMVDVWKTWWEIKIGEVSMRCTRRYITNNKTFWMAIETIVFVFAARFSATFEK